ncbi:MAG: response regulator, partial [Bdellovibrionota bacterium]
MAGKKLLVADDSLTIQKVIRLALSSEGYEIQAVSDGNDAVQKIPLFRPDVVLIDVSLPGKSAVEVKRLINDDRDLDEVRFVLMSSAFEKIDEEMISQVRFHGKLTKPFDPAHLRQVLSEVLAEVAAERMQPTSIMPPPLPPPPPSRESPFQVPESPPPLPFASRDEFSNSSIEAPPFTNFEESPAPSLPFQSSNENT